MKGRNACSHFCTAPTTPPPHCCVLFAVFHTPWDSVDNVLCCILGGEGRGVSLVENCWPIFLFEGDAILAFILPYSRGYVGLPVHVCPRGMSLRLPVRVVFSRLFLVLKNIGKI